MASLRVIYDETDEKMLLVGQPRQLGVADARKVAASKLRYCLENNMLFLPSEEYAVNAAHRLSWVRASFEDALEHPWLADFGGSRVPMRRLLRLSGDIGLGLYYSRRHVETSDGRQAIAELCSQALIDKVASDPSVLDDISHRDFELLMGELFARMGFEVDVFRGTKDGGIDFLAIQSSESDTVVASVQCKQPEKRAGRELRTIGVSMIREMYGVAKWNGHARSIMLTTSSYSTDAKQFAEAKPGEMELADRARLLEWIVRHRWNSDE